MTFHACICHEPSIRRYLQPHCGGPPPWPEQTLAHQRGRAGRWAHMAECCPIRSAEADPLETVTVLHSSRAWTCSCGCIDLRMLNTMDCRRASATTRTRLSKVRSLSRRDVHPIGESLARSMNCVHRRKAISVNPPWHHLRPSMVPTATGAGPAGPDIPYLPAPWCPIRG